MTEPGETPEPIDPTHMVDALAYAMVAFKPMAEKGFVAQHRIDVAALNAAWREMIDSNGFRLTEAPTSR